MIFSIIFLQVCDKSKEAWAGAGAGVRAGAAIRNFSSSSGRQFTADSSAEAPQHLSKQ